MNQDTTVAIEPVAKDADVFSGLWTLDLRNAAQMAAQGMFDAESLRADADKADIDIYSSVTTLLAAQSPTHDADGLALEVHQRVQAVTWGWYSSVRIMVLEAYRAKRPGLKDNSYDQAWKRVIGLIDRVLKGGFKAPTSDNPEAMRKAQDRAAAKAKREAAQGELLAAYEGKSAADLQSALKVAYTKAAKGDVEGEREAERIKSVMSIRNKEHADEVNSAVSERWKKILTYSKRKVDGQDNPLFVSDIRVLDAVLDVLQSQ